MLPIFIRTKNSGLARVLLGGSEGEEVSDFDSNFERAVDTAFSVDSSDILQNGSLAHARYLIASLVKKASVARSDVKISSGSLNEFVFGSDEIIEAARAVLANGNRIDVVCEKTPDNGQENKFLQLLKEHEELCSAMQRDENIKTEGAWRHFTLVGEKAFRIEISHKTAEAFGCFNNIAFADRLKNLFVKQVQSSAAI
jgi:hypothetical protein